MERELHQKRHLAAGILLALLAFFMAFTMFSTSASAASKKKSKSKKVRIMIADTSNNSNVQNQVRCIKRCGATYTLVRNKKANINKYDGLIIPGGGDINPSLYGQRNRGSRNINTKSDKLQIYWVKRFKAAGKPILGVCKGAQVINVALGGTLKQDIGSHMARNLYTSFSKGSWLRSLYGSGATTVHYHHQVCAKMGTDLVVTARSGGVVEAFEHKTLPIYGIQWHPDHMSASFGNKVYKSFIKKCKSYRK